MLTGVGKQFNVFCELIVKVLSLRFRPCKQLGPLLEDAAIRAGGIFRLVKLNADSERSFVEALQVKAFPSVYAVQNGAINDRCLSTLQDSILLMLYSADLLVCYQEKKLSNFS